MNINKRPPFILNYAKLNVDQITVEKFGTHKKLVEFVDTVTINRKNECVWVLTKSELEDIFITHKIITLQEILKTSMCWQTVGDYFLQEYDSYEEAYKVALQMQEPTGLAYSEVDE